VWVGGACYTACTFVTTPSLRGKPEKIFISVDESSGRSTLSFMPPDVGTPIQYTDDKSGSAATKDAQAIAAKHPGCQISGPHFHAARPEKARIRKRPPPQQQ
jgi:hypothetical protein